MTREEAAALLEIEADAPIDRIRGRCQELYNDYQVRITNAPTPALKRSYEQRLREVERAGAALVPGGLDSLKDLPTAEPVQPVRRPEPRGAGPSPETPSLPSVRGGWSQLPPSLQRVLILSASVVGIVAVFVIVMSRRNSLPANWGVQGEWAVEHVTQNCTQTGTLTIHTVVLKSMFRGYMSIRMCNSDYVMQDAYGTMIGKSVMIAFTNPRGYSGSYSPDNYSLSIVGPDKMTGSNMDLASGTGNLSSGTAVTLSRTSKPPEPSSK